MNRALFEVDWLEPNNLPEWNCPICNDGKLEAKGEVKLVDQSEGFESQIYDIQYDDNGQEHEIFWDLSLISGKVFGPAHVLLQCSRKACKTNVLCVGKHMNHMWVSDDRREGGTETLFKPLFFQPTLRLISIPNGFDESFKEAVQSASAVFWSNSNLCLNRVRTAFEILLETHTSFASTEDSLYKNIKLNKEVFATLLGARKKLPNILKFLGNLGTHELGATREQALDGLELLDYVIFKLSDDRDDKIHEILGKHE